MLMVAAALIAVGGCKGTATNNMTNAQAPVANPSGPTTSSTVSAANETRVETMNRTDTDGQRIQTKELVGPDVQEPGVRPLSYDEVQEIEKATGRPYQEGDSIYGRAEPVKNGQ